MMGQPWGGSQFYRLSMIAHKHGRTLESVRVFQLACLISNHYRGRWTGQLHLHCRTVGKVEVERAVLLPYAVDLTFCNRVSQFLIRSHYNLPSNPLFQTFPPALLFQEKLVWCILSNTSKVSGTQVGNPGWFGSHLRDSEPQKRIHERSWNGLHSIGSLAFRNVRVVNGPS